MAQALDAVALHEPHRAGVEQRPDCFGTVTLCRAHELFGNFVERGVPRQRRKLTAAFCAFAFERVLEAVWMVHALGIARDFLADHTRGIAVRAGTADAPDVVRVELFDFERAGTRTVVGAGAVNVGGHERLQLEHVRVSTGNEFTSHALLRRSVRCAGAAVAARPAPDSTGRSLL